MKRKKKEKAEQKRCGFVVRISFFRYLSFLLLLLSIHSFSKPLGSRAELEPKLLVMKRIRFDEFPADSLAESVLPPSLTEMASLNVLEALNEVATPSHLDPPPLFNSSGKTCQQLNSFLISKGCVGEQRIASAFAAGKEHSSLGAALAFLAESIRLLLTKGVKNGASIAEQWENYVQQGKDELQSYAFELQGFSSLLAFMWAQLVSAEYRHRWVWEQASARKIKVASLDKDGTNEEGDEKPSQGPKTNLTPERSGRGGRRSPGASKGGRGGKGASKSDSRNKNKQKSAQATTESDRAANGGETNEASSGRRSLSHPTVTLHSPLKVESPALPGGDDPLGGSAKHSQSILVENQGAFPKWGSLSSPHGSLSSSRISPTKPGEGAKNNISLDSNSNHRVGGTQNSSSLDSKPIHRLGGKQPIAILDSNLIPRAGGAPQVASLDSNLIHRVGGTQHDTVMGSILSHRAPGSPLGSTEEKGDAHPFATSGRMPERATTALPERLSSAEKGPVPSGNLHSLSHASKGSQESSNPLPPPPPPSSAAVVRNSQEAHSTLSPDKEVKKASKSASFLLKSGEAGSCRKGALDKPKNCRSSFSRSLGSHMDAEPLPSILAPESAGPSASDELDTLKSPLLLKGLSRKPSLKDSSVPRKKWNRVTPEAEQEQAPAPPPGSIRTAFISPSALVSEVPRFFKAVSPQPLIVRPIDGLGAPMRGDSGAVSPALAFLDEGEYPDLKLLWLDTDGSSPADRNVSAGVPVARYREPAPLNVEADLHVAMLEGASSRRKGSVSKKRLECHRRAEEVKQVTKSFMIPPISKLHPSTNLPFEQAVAALEEQEKVENLKKKFGVSKITNFAEERDATDYRRALDLEMEALFNESI